MDDCSLNPLHFSAKMKNDHLGNKRFSQMEQQIWLAFFHFSTEKEGSTLSISKWIFWFVAQSSSYDSDDGEEGHDVGDN